jgi:hypothetical protein
MLIKVPMEHTVAAGNLSLPDISRIEWSSSLSFMKLGKDAGRERARKAASEACRDAQDDCAAI